MTGPRPSLLPITSAIVTDAWYPQTNGVVRTLSTTLEVLRGWGHRVEVISPRDYASVPCPTYPEIRLALAPPGRSEEHTSELQSLMRNSYAVFCLKKKNNRHESLITQNIM